MFINYGNNRMEGVKIFSKNTRQSEKNPFTLQFDL